MNPILERLLAMDGRVWVALSFMPIAGLFVFALYRADRGNSSTFKLVHFVTNDVGRGSMYALGYTMLVVVCAWGIWALIVLGQLTEWYVTAVCGVFVLGALGGTTARLVSKIKGAVDAPAAAGDSDEPPAPAIDRTTQTTERIIVPQADPPAKPKGRAR